MHLQICLYALLLESIVPVDRELNVDKSFRRRPGRPVKVLCTFDLRLVSAGVSIINTENAEFVVCLWSSFK